MISKSSKFLTLSAYVVLSGHALADTGPRQTEILERFNYSWFLPVSESAIEIDVDTTNSTMTVRQDGRIIAMSRVSIGSHDTPTPVGEFSILLLRERHFSSEIEGAVMPFSMFFDNAGNAIHAGDLSTRSNGCVRIPYHFAESLFEISSKGNLVRIR